MIVLYKSNYSHTEFYAKCISEELGADLLRIDKANIESLEKYKTIIYGEGIYAGGFKGAKKFKKIMERYGDKKNYIFFSTSISDPKKEDHRSAIMEGIKNSIGAENTNHVKVFMLRGGLNYKKLNLLHRIMMMGLVSMLKKKPDEDKTSDDISLIETYGGELDFTNKSDLDELYEYLRGLN